MLASGNSSETLQGDIGVQPIGKLLCLKGNRTTTIAIMVVKDELQRAEEIKSSIHVARSVSLIHSFGR